MSVCKEVCEEHPGVSCIITGPHSWHVAAGEDGSLIEWETPVAGKMSRRQVMDAVQATRLRVMAEASPESGTDWLEVAYQAALAVAKRQHFFTADDVWAALGGSGFADRDPRHMGSVMNRLASEGVAESTDRSVASSRRRGHARVWKSSVCEEVRASA